jgi:8-oxo-dGTP pyrophosphatase MutT (NUDIX family)
MVMVSLLKEFPPCPTESDIMQKDERILQIEQNLSWLPQPNEGRTVLSSQLPPGEMIATALVLAFDRDRLLQTHLAARGWDIVGGHIEPGESPEEAARREAYEEAGARLRELHVLGYQRLRLLGPRPASYRYSYPDSYQVFYWAQIEALDEFIATEEARERALFAPGDAHELPFVRTLRELYLVALQATMR